MSGRRPGDAGGNPSPSSSGSFQHNRRRRRATRNTAAVASRPASSHSHRAPKLTDKSTIVLAEFSNATGDPAFDGALRQILAVQLENSPRLSLLPDARVSQALSLMGRPTSAKLTPDVAAEICERTASAAVVEGSITSLGKRVRVDLASKELPDRRYSGSGAGASSNKKRTSSRRWPRWPNGSGARAGESLPRVEKEPQFLGRRNHVLTGGVAVVQTQQ